MPRYQVTFEFWSENDDEVVRAVNRSKEEIVEETQPYPTYVKDSGIATGDVEVIGPIQVADIEANSYERVA